MSGIMNSSHEKKSKQVRNTFGTTHKAYPGEKGTESLVSPFG